MIQTQVRKHAEKFEQKVKAWDKEVSSFSTEQQKEYRKYRQAFMKRLDVWKRRAESEWNSFSGNIEEGFHELEARFNDIKSK